MTAIRVFLLAFGLALMSLFPMAFAKSVALKTIVVNVPTEYGVLTAEIHFDEKNFSIASKVEQVIKNDLVKIVNYFQYVPHSIVHFNIDPYVQTSNGSARVFPTSVVSLYNFPPSNDDHLIVMEDWMRGLVFHEYMHISHLDQTRDYLKIGEHIFGTFAKTIPGIVPRWFTEGIAVWAESYLIEGGRLHAPLFHREWLNQFLRPKYCATIDCLDEPGVYPGTQLPYWAGAHFIAYLEEKKPGTVKCLVESNAGNIPFFLNKAFTTCTGRTAQEHFGDFRNDLLKEQTANDVENPLTKGEKIENSFGSDNLQKGVLVQGNILFKVERDRKREALASYDLEENVPLVTSQFSFPIATLADSLSLKIEGDQEGEQKGDQEAKFLIIALNDDPTFRTSNRTWKLVNAETLLVEYELPFKNDPSYVISLGPHLFLTASFVDNSWQVERQKVEGGAFVSSELLYRFPSSMNLTFLKRRGEKLFFKIHQASAVSLYASRLNFEQSTKLYESKNYFDFPLLTENFLVLREKETLKLFEWDEGLKKLSTSLLDPHVLGKATFIEAAKDRLLVLQNDLKSTSMTIKKGHDYLKANAKKTQTNNLIFTKLSDHSQSSLATSPQENYPQLYHLRPHWWFFAFGSSSELRSIGAMTSLADPMEIYNMNASILFYEEKKIGGSMDYLQKFSSINDLWSLSATFNREYSKSQFSSRINEETKASLGTQYTFLMKRWTMIPGLYVAGTKTQDFISNRSLRSVGAGHRLFYNALSFDDYFQNFSSQIKVQLDQPNVGDSFINAQLRLVAEGRFHKNLMASLQTSYGKLFKDNFSQGVLYGGGVTQLGENRWYEFYGVPYANAYGNEIFTMRATIDYNAWNVYRGYGFLPFFLKEVHLLLGREAMYADRIFLGNKILREETIHSSFAGTRLKANLFYGIPSDIDLIWSLVEHPDGRNLNNVLFSIKADLF